MATPITTALTASGVRDVYIAEERYAIVVTSGGLDVVDMYKGYVISSGTLPSEPTTIAVDWQSSFGKLYVGTTSSGIFSMNYVLVREPHRDFTGDLVQSFTTTTPIPVSSNQINDLDVLPGRLLIGTGAGIDFVADEEEYATRPLISGSEHVHLTTEGGYWTTATGVFLGGVEVNYDLLSTTGTSIIDVDFEYRKTSNPALPTEPPFDITVTEPTDGPLPAIGVATSGGVFVFEELPGNEAATNSRVLAPGGNFISVDFGPNASFEGGCLYAAVPDFTLNLKEENIGGSVLVFDLTNDAVSGTHTSQDGTRDMTVVTGTVNIVRAVDAGICPTSEEDD
jgi:hypothetical protein